MSLLENRCNASGPSVAAVEIVPITYNDDNVILFKTRYEINRDGIAGLATIEYGWLVLSSDGIWEEHPHVTLSPEGFSDATKKMRENFHSLEGEFRNPFSWESSPQSIQEILHKYGFQQRIFPSQDSYSELMGAMQKRTEVCDKCLKVSSIHNLSTFLTKYDALKITFYHAGIMLIENIRNDSDTVGADFGIAHFMRLERDDVCKDYGIDIQAIDGIVIEPMQ